MRRAAQDKHVAEREWHKHWLTHVHMNKFDGRPERIGKSAYEVSCECDEQKGRFRKRHGLGCPKVRCGLCKRDKYPIRNNGKEKQKVQKEMREAV